MKSPAATLIAPIGWIGLLLLVAGSLPAAGQDIRAAARKAQADRQRAEQESRDAEARILADRDSLSAVVAELEAQVAGAEREIVRLEREIASADTQREQWEENWARRELDFREVSGTVRVAARDLETLLRASSLSADRPERLEPLEPLLRPNYFPDIDDISAVADLFLDEMVRTGHVSRREAAFVARDGVAAEGRLYQFGPFTSVYRSGEEHGFLTYSPESQRLYALRELPDRGTRRALQRYLDGASPAVPLDLSGGTALRQVARSPSLIEQVRAGGPIVWPILLLALIALGLVVYKAIFLHIVHGRVDRVTGQLSALAGRGDWEACDQLMEEHRGRHWPVIRVLRAGLAVRGQPRSVIESVLQEAILHELPRLRRGLAALAVFGAVAPLLGLLGTVTGMIDTFRVITIFGTSDPKLMSGGISEALITTELGLVVAIPIMLLHTLLSRRVHHVIGDMEESAVQLTNLMELRRAGSSGAEKIGMAHG